MNRNKSLSKSRLQSNFKEYLQGSGLEQATISTRCTDSFYIWNNVSSEKFWEVIESDDFESTAKEVLLEALKSNSTTNPDQSVNGYLSHLRVLRDFILSNDSNCNEADDMDSLKNFILDIDCLDPLSEWTSKFNMFDILKISRTEIRHSNMLAWLLDPKENHGLGDDVIRRFVQYATTAFSNAEDLFEILLKDCDGFHLQREYHHIDILAVSDEEKIVLCIENKIDSGEHDNQLVRYRKIVEEQYPNYIKLYIFLSPNGDEPSDSEYWCSMSYQDVLDIIEQSKKRAKLIPESEMMINNYIETIRRDIVGDENLARVCAEIYKKHKKAIDLIIENKPDKASELAEIFRKWGKKKTESGEIELVLDKSIKTYTRFKTSEMSAYLPDSDEPLSGWNTKNNYFFEIYNNNGNEFFIQFALSSKNLSEEMKEKCERINGIYPSKQQKMNWQWRTCKKTKSRKVDDDFSEEKIIKQLDEQLQEIKEFENDLFARLNFTVGEHK